VFDGSALDYARQRVPSVQRSRTG